MQKVVFPIVALVGFLSLVMLYLAGTGYQAGTFELGQAFTIMRWCAYGGISAVGLVIFTMLWLRPAGLPLLVLFVSAMAGLMAFYLPYRQQQIAAQVPPIHDISTNTANPPEFVAVAPLRANAPNSPQYAGPETAALQHEHYPDIMTQVYVQSPQEVFEAITGIIADMGWEMVDANMADGRIEATAVTRWFGFRDDVVFRLQAGPANSTIMDMRSKSRVGRSDIGVNANRIRTFTAVLNDRLVVQD